MNASRIRLAQAAATAVIFLVVPLFSAAATCGNLAVGSTGAQVTALQQFLIAQGLLNSTATGYFGTLTQAAVQGYQSSHGIVSSGTPATTGYGAVGPHTRLAMGLACVVGSLGAQSSTKGSSYLLTRNFGDQIIPHTVSVPASNVTGTVSVSGVTNGIAVTAQETQEMSQVQTLEGTLGSDLTTANAAANTQ